MSARHVLIGQPVHASEQQALQFLVHALPSGWTVYSNIDVPSGRAHGGSYEHDAIVVAPHAVFAIEIKGYAGHVKGNRDRWTLASGAMVTAPIPLLLSKARALKGWLAGNDHGLNSIRVEGLVFLSAEDAVADLSGEFGHMVVTRRDIARVLLDTSWVQGGALHGSARSWVEKRLNDGQPPRPRPIPGYQVQQQLDSEHPSYELWLARDDLTGAQRLLHIHLIEGRTEAEQQRRVRAAQREAMVYDKLKGASGVLAYFGHVSDDSGSAQRYALAFEDTTPLLPLPTWLAEFRPGMQTRIAVAQKLAAALAEVHARKVIHRRLHAGAVFVQPVASPERVVLVDFETAKDVAGHAPTVTTRALTQPAHLCAAPEHITRGIANERTDLFSLGAILVHLLTDRALFRSVDDVVRQFNVPHIVYDGLPYPPVVQGVVHELLQTDPQLRPVSARGIADRLAAFLLGGEKRDEVLEAGTTVEGRYRLESELGTGATSQTWLATDLRLQARVVLKILYAEHHESAEREKQVLTAVHHNNLVGLTDSVVVQGRTALVLVWADGIGADLQAAAGDPLTLVQFRRVADGLLGALGALHGAGWLHRDIKPQNMILRDLAGTCSPLLLDVGLAARDGVTTDLAVGTLRYKDPAVYQDGRWSRMNDLFAAALVLYELATGTHAFGSEIPSPGLDPALDARLMPQAWSEPIRQRLVAWLERALSGQRTQRPESAEEWLGDLRSALAEIRPEPAGSGPALPPHARPEHWLSDLPGVHKRALGAAARLGVRTLGQLAGLELREAELLPGVGVVALGELRQLAKAGRERWPDHASEARDVEPLCRELVADQQPLEAVDGLLDGQTRDKLFDAGIHTVGVLAQLPRAGVHDLAGFAEDDVARLRRRLRRMAGVEALPASLEELVEAIRADIGLKWEALSLRFGLAGGEEMDPVELAEVLDAQLEDLPGLMGLPALRAPTSAGPALQRLVDDVLPPIGFARDSDVAESLAVRLSGLSADDALGWVRLSQVLRAPDSAPDGATSGWVGLDSWTDARLATLRGTLASIASWPPAPRTRVVQAIDGVLEAPLRQFLVAHSLDAGAILDALLALDGRPCALASGAMYMPPVTTAQALAWLREQGSPELSEPQSEEALLALVRAGFEGLVETDFASAALQAGLLRDGERWFDPDRVQVAVAEGAILVDPGIRRERRQFGGLPTTVQHLVDAVDSGGLRVVCTRPAQHHALGQQLASWLADAAGAERVRRVDVEAVLLDALRSDPKKWALVPAFEKATRQTWKWIEPDCRAALEAALAESRPGSVTVLTDTALLGTLDLLPWLQGLYERARGGKLGLLVLVVPGGVHEQRIRMNESHPFPYTPDMAAVLLEAAA